MENSDLYSEDSDNKDQITERPGFFSRIRLFFDARKRRKKGFTFSRFYYLIERLNKRDPVYADARLAVDMCDEAISIINRRLSLLEQISGFDRQLAELSCYENVTDEDAKSLKDMISRYKSVNRDKDELKGQITSFDPALAKMAQLEEEAQAIMPEIKDAERRQRLFKQDIHYLRGEKTDLEIQRETLVKGFRFVNRFLTTVMIVFVLCVTIMGFAAVISQVDIAVPLTIVTILAIILTALLYGFRNRFKYEMDLNLKKQQKATGMLNTKNAVFAHYTNFLNFVYKKYKVRNAEMLKKHLREYDHYKHLTRRFDAFRKLSEETEKDIKTLLHRLRIPTGTLTLDSFAKVFNLDEKRDIYKSAVEGKASAEGTLRLLDERQEQLWDALLALEKRDGGLVGKIIGQYMLEAGKMLGSV